MNKSGIQVEQNEERRQDGEHIPVTGRFTGCIELSSNVLYLK